MHGANLFTELSLVIAIGAAIAAIMKFLKQPLIIGHIITGIIAGPTLLNIIHDEGSFTVFSNIGVALLLFIIGLELNIKVFSRLGRAVFVTTGVQLGGVTLLGSLTAKALGFGMVESLVIGFCLALSSTIIIIKSFNDKRELTRLYAQIALGILLLQDVVATGGKIFLATQSQGNGSLFSIVLLLLRGTLLVVGLYILSTRALPKLTKSLETSKELMLLFALGWALGFAMLFEKAGLSIELGALFAGVSMASLPYGQEVVSRLKPLRDFFIVIFFITLGHSMVPTQLGKSLVAALALILIVMIIKPILVLTSMGYLGYTKRASFKTALSMSQISEFSLVFLFAATAIGITSEHAKATLTLVALFTFAASSYLMKYDEQLYNLLGHRLKFFERKIVKEEQLEARQQHPIVLLGYRKGGAEFIRTFQQMKKRFVVVDYDPEAIEQLESQHINFLYGDVTDPELIDELDIAQSKLIVSTISDFETNKFLAHLLTTRNPSAVFICNADSAYHAARLYSEGASYVMMPHFIGSEKIGSFLKKSGFSKAEFHKFREKHLQYLETHYAQEKPA